MKRRQLARTQKRGRVGKRKAPRDVQGGFLHKVVPAMLGFLKSVYKPKWDKSQLELAHRRRTIR